MNKTRNLFNKQKLTIEMIPVSDKHKNLNFGKKMKDLDILNIYKQNISQILNMFREKINLKLEIFQKNCKVLKHNYSTGHGKFNFKASNISFRVTKFQISSSALLNNKLIVTF